MIWEFFPIWLPLISIGDKNSGRFIICIDSVYESRTPGPVIALDFDEVSQIVVPTATVFPYIVFTNPWGNPWGSAWQACLSIGHRFPFLALPSPAALCHLIYSGKWRLRSKFRYFPDTLRPRRTWWGTFTISIIFYCSLFSFPKNGWEEPPLIKTHWGLWERRFNTRRKTYSYETNISHEHEPSPEHQQD